MGELLDFPTTYLPTLQEKERLEEIQRQLSYWRAELSREHKLKQLNAGQIWLSRQRYHNGFRDNWKIYPGFKEDAKRQKEG